MGSPEMSFLGRQRRLEPTDIGQFRSQLLTQFAPEDLLALVQGGGIQGLQSLIGQGATAPFAFEQGGGIQPLMSLASPSMAQAGPLSSAQITAAGQTSAAPIAAAPAAASAQLSPMLAAMSGAQVQVSPMAILQALAQLERLGREPDMISGQRIPERRTPSRGFETEIPGSPVI